MRHYRDGATVDKESFMADMESSADVGTQSQEAPTVSHVESSSVSDGSSKPIPTEKTFSQSEVNKIAARVREQTRTEYASRYQPAEQNQQQSNSQSGMGGMINMSSEQLERLVQDKIKEQSHLETAKQIANDFTNKMMAAKDKHPDFEEAVSQLNLPTIPHIVHWANSLDNTADVMYDIAKNPSKFANILMLSQTAPQLAQREMQKLSDSIKKNVEAQNQPSVKEPLSQIKPSPVGTDNGSMTVRDLRKQAWLRG